ncbi:adenylate/guanylate cyclase domain-containing protein [Altericista sp. CCNU0014]|uniref:adenylate/guanylate cyclase domain-containing protein n=1 Tax=Altericista sp. CCNU0014 TaxID=3082949 RepID=UPI0038511046
MDDLVETLASYVPSFIVRRLLQDATPIACPLSERYAAVAVFIDISGFTKLTEYLMQSGSAGLEELTQILNAYFGQTIDLIHQYRGDVVKFAGDGLLALWLSDSRPETLKSQVLYAGQCALTIQETLQTHVTVENVSLSLRISVAAGEIAIAHLGGINKRWEFALSGVPLVQTKQLQKQANPGWVVISSDAWTLIQADSQGSLLEHGNVRLLCTNLKPPPISLQQPALPRDLEAGLKAYIPAAILTRLGTGHREWLAEYRWVTLLFVNLPNLEDISLQQAQDAMLAIQTNLYRFEGSINKISVDDKGATLVAVMGLPPFAHENDAERGVKAAMAMQVALTKLGWKCSIGVTTGNVFCGAIGSAKRREYTTIGNKVNLAARLMQVARECILCDATTYKATRQRITFRALPSVCLKGIEQPVIAYQPLKFNRQIPLEPISNLVGRGVERQRLIRWLETCLQRQRRGIFIVEGEAGIGKSQLIASFLTWMQAQDIAYLIGSGDAIEQNTPYYLWRQILSQLLPIADGPNAEFQSVRLRQALNLPADLEPLMPLLNFILGVNFPETALTRSMLPSVRSENTRLMLLEIIRHSLGHAKPIIILENAQWIDSASWSLLLAACQQSFPIQFVILSRPSTQDGFDGYLRLKQLSIVETISLQRLSREETGDLICQKLNASSISKGLLLPIYQKTEGHPLYSMELAQSLLGAGNIQIRPSDRQLILSSSVSLAVELPTTLQALIMDRIDHLSPPQQLALKTASAIGRSFVYPLLHEIYPLETDKPDLPIHLQGLQEINLITLIAPSENIAYSFQSLITQDVAYHSMLFAQRRALHHAIAEWYERNQSANLAAYYPRLVYHWSRAKNSAKTLQFLAKAGDRAFQGGAYAEAVSFFTKALTLSSAELPQPALLRASWHRQLAEAYIGLGQLPKGITQLQCAVRLLDSPIPETNRSLALGLLRNILRQVCHLMGLPKGNKVPASVQETRLELTRAYICLGEAYYYAHCRTLATYASSIGLNLAESLPPSPELASIYANMCFVVGTNKMHGLARHYAKLADRTVQRIHTPLSSHGWVLLVTGAYKSGCGQWESAREALDRAAEIFHRTRERHHLAEALSAIALIDHCQGNFNAALSLWQQTLSLGEEGDDIQAQSWGLLGQAEEFLCLGQYEEAQHCTQLAQVILSPQEQLICEQIRLMGISALISFNRGDVPTALESALKSLNLIRQSPPIAIYILEGYASTAQVYLLLLKHHPELIRPYMREVSIACQAMDRYANAFAIGKSRAFRLNGYKAWLEGNDRRARRLWQEALLYANRLTMPYERACSHYEYGCHLQKNSSLKQQHLREAVRGFERLGAQHHLALAQQSLSQSR